MLIYFPGFQRRTSFSSFVKFNQFILIVFLVGGFHSALSAPPRSPGQEAPEYSEVADQLARQEYLNSELARLLNKYVLIQTEKGYILGRSQRSGSAPGARERRLPTAERNFQLRVRKNPESNFQLRVRKAPRLERNFQLRVRKSMPSMDKNFQLRVRKPFPGAESNFQLRVRKAIAAASSSSAMPDRDFQLRVRKAPRLERNFQLRVRKSDPGMSAFNPSAMQELLQRYQLLRTPDGGYLLQDMEKRNAEELEDELEEENQF